MNGFWHIKMTTENNILPLAEFKQVVENTPLFAIDLVVVNEQNQVLVGERLNAPAKGFWFVPGGRVFKNESLGKAFKRISKTELGFEVERHQTWLLGLFDHFYDDSFFSKKVSTHYINATHAIRLTANLLNLPENQHSQYRWLSLEALQEDYNVHPFSKVFLAELTPWIKNND